MSIPFFYNSGIKSTDTSLVLNEETSKHVIQVLRMKNGERLHFTDGKGNLFDAELIADDRKKAAVKILSTSFLKAPEKKITIAISLIKNAGRFEWFLEKATEIGVQEIIPLICSRTEKQHFRFERMQGILISAMQQSQQSRLPVLSEPVTFNKILKRGLFDKQLIAHCEEDGQKNQLVKITGFNSVLILIGPEGDFTPEEIDEATQNNFIPVALGESRLRTETAGIVAATLLRNN